MSACPSRFRLRTGCILALSALFLPAAAARAAGDAATPPASSFEYPELSVTPRASVRLEREAAREGSFPWTALTPFYVSGVVTLTTGIIQKGNYDLSKDPSGQSGYAGIAVGGAWLAGMVALAAAYHPYSAGQADIASMPQKTERDQLFRERVAEEDLDAPARLIRRLAWVSVVSNFAANTYMLTQAQSGSLAIPANIVGMAASLTPLLFQSYWIQVANEQREYKKRIYAPVASAAVLPEPGTSRLAPGMTLSFLF